MNNLRTLVVYYSKGGHTRDLALELAFDLEADLMEIHEAAPYKGVAGWLRRIVETVFDLPCKTLPFTHEPLLYDIVLVGAPSWGGFVCPPVKAFLRRCWDRLPNIGFFVTSSRWGAQAVLQDMEALAQQIPLARLAVSTKDVERSEYLDSLEDFENRISLRADILAAMNSGTRASTW